MLDSTADEVFITDLTGACLPDSYDTINFANFGSPQGIGYNADDNVSAIVDNSADKVYPVDDRGEITSQFDLGALGVNDPSAILEIPGFDTLAILDDVDDAIVVTDKLGVVQFQCSTTFFGADFPQGLALRPGINQLLVVDNTDDEVYAITPAPACALEEQYDTFKWGADIVTGIASNLATGELFHTDSSDDAIYVSDSSGVLTGQYSYGVVYGTFGNGTPQDISYIPSAGNLAIVDNTHDQVFVMNSLGFREMYFDTAFFGATNPEGISVAETTGEVFIVDSSADEVYTLSLPRLLEPTTASGTFAGSIPDPIRAAAQVGPQATTLIFELKETGGGFFSGTATIPGTFTFDAPGFVDQTTGIMWITLIVPGVPGSTVPLPFFVLEDFSGIFLLGANVFFPRP